ncbi:MAG: alpha/beta hydrolase [Pseudomonadota bacterium]
MKAREADILILPGLGGGAPDTWYHRWLPKLGTARRVEQPDFWAPDRDVWVANVLSAVHNAERPVVIIGHSAGVITAVHSAATAPAGKIHGAFFVGTPDLASHLEEFPQAATLLPPPMDKLAFPSLMVASRTDPYCAYDVAAGFAASWGSRLIDAGDAGHLNADSGHGPWPEGSLTFARFISSL